MRFFGLFTDFFFSQFTSDFPFSQISVTDIEELHCSRANKFSSLFEASAFSLAGAAESYWKQNGDFVQAQKFKELRRRIFNDPLSVVCSFPPAK